MRPLRTDLSSQISLRLNQKNMKNAEMDSELCNVSVPPQMIQRLQSIDCCEQCDLNLEIAEVAIPGGLMLRLKQSIVIECAERKQ